MLISWTRLLNWVVLLGSAGMSTLALADDFRLGFVNTDRIFRESRVATQAHQRLEGEFAKREKDITRLGEELSKESAALEKEALTLSQSALNAKKKTLADREKELQRKSREFQEDLNSRRNEELQQLLEKANKMIKQIAEAEKYDIVLQEAVYVNPKHDMTDRVIKALNGVAAGK